MDKLEGIISLWLPDRGFGFIVVGQGKDVKKFYYHITRVVSGQPAVGATASFSVLPIREGKLPSATEIEVKS